MMHIFKDAFDNRHISEFLYALEQQLALALFGPVSPSTNHYSFIPMGVPSPILLFPFRI